MVYSTALFAILNFIQSGYIDFFGLFELDFGIGFGNWVFHHIVNNINKTRFKLSATSYCSMANMRKVAPKMQQIREQYSDSRERLGQEMMKLYKKEKINP